MTSLRKPLDTSSLRIKKPLINGKKGFVGDVALWVVFIAVFAFAAVLVYQVNSEIKTSVDADASIVQEAKDQVGNITTPMPLWIDSVLMMLFVGAGALLFFSVFFISDFPGLFIFIWLFIGILIIIGAVLSNTYEEFAADPDVSTFADDFVFLPFLMGNFPYVILFWGVSLALGLFFKDRI